MESVWWVFAELYEKGLVYEGFKVMPFSARLEHRFRISRLILTTEMSMIRR